MCAALLRGSHSRSCTHPAHCAPPMFSHHTVFHLPPSQVWGRISPPALARGLGARLKSNESSERTRGLRRHTIIRMSTSTHRSTRPLVANQPAALWSCAFQLVCPPNHLVVQWLGSAAPSVVHLSSRLRGRSLARPGAALKHCARHHRPFWLRYSRWHDPCFRCISCRSPHCVLQASPRHAPERFTTRPALRLLPRARSTVNSRAAHFAYAENCAIMEASCAVGRSRL